MTEAGKNNTEHGHGATSLIATRQVIDDKLIRWIGIPLFGLGIPNLTGLFGNLGYGDLYYWLGYIYFVGLSWSIWMGNRWLLFQQRKHWDWFSNPVQKLLVLISANVFYTFPLTVAWISGWYYFAAMPVDWDAIYTVTLMNVICVIFVTHSYETVFLIREREGDALSLANNEKARALAELEALKNQVDPHFLFNSLNTLSHLIEDSPEKALKFNERLADVYRYILMSKGKNLVWLQEELTFLQNYIFLVQLRFGDSLILQQEFEEGHSNYLIPPIALQTLAENAIKHNEFDETKPMYLNLKKRGSDLYFSNPKYPRQTPVTSTRKGLINLSERFKLLVEKDIEIKDKPNKFHVKLPLVSA
ncbi:MAG: sensor histidine kinase [Owenweeksia sp.]